MLIDGILNLIDSLIIEQGLSRIHLKRAFETGKQLNYIETIIESDNYEPDNYINLDLDDKVLLLYASVPGNFVNAEHQILLGDPSFKQKLNEHLINLNNIE